MLAQGQIPIALLDHVQVGQAERIQLLDTEAQHVVERDPALSAGPLDR